MHFGSPSTVAGATAATPMKMAQVFGVALWLATALQPVPPVGVNVMVTPADGVKLPIAAIGVATPARFLPVPAE